MQASRKLDLLPSPCNAGEAVAEAVRRRVREETKLTCSCGIGPNRLLSKIATDINKPDGQFAVGRDHKAIQRFIDPLPIRKVPGIGKVGHASQNCC
jgi:DNA polymerase kappa